MSEYTPISPEGAAAGIPPPQIAFEPVQLRPRHDGWTAERQIRFIEVLAATRCVDAACRSVGMSDTSAYELRNRLCGAAFRRAWDIALDYQVDAVEQSAIERTVHGVPRPIFYKGEKVGEYRHYDERLTMFLLRTRRAHRYGKWLEHAPMPPPAENKRRCALDDAISRIAITAPERWGNPLGDWDADDEPGDAGEAIAEGGAEE